MKNPFLAFTLVSVLLLPAISFAETPPPKPTPAPASQAAGFKLDDYLKDLGDTLKLSDPQKQRVQQLYLADADAVKATLNDPALSAEKKSEDYEALRVSRNEKIDQVLEEDQKAAFPAVEDKYRVDLTKLALNQGWAVAPPPPAPAPASPTNNAPATKK